MSWEDSGRFRAIVETVKGMITRRVALRLSDGDNGRFASLVVFVGGSSLCLNTLFRMSIHYRPAIRYART
ncbi:unnamed protein product [Enterobius vermicularis]|uniref:Transposase n=1 Tax=Enterobius vermicularis TaxID=51028 RepID=A0A0N4VI17_ENTVE|nr:unnamed protein product [Enterobius vermicularis]